jgi:2-polyprenyl-3-methyl-5-hydroxy-6-metoxy-1,4-benzoquinol methylase
MKLPTPKSLFECPVCKSDHFSNVAEVFDDRYGHPGEFRLVRCDHCDHLMTSPQLRESDLPVLYGTYYPRKLITAESVVEQATGVANWSAKWKRWLSGTDNQGQYGVRAGERLLDIGCGSGVSLLEAQSLGAQVWGIEADPNVQVIARTLGLRVHEGNLHDKPFLEVQFDIVVMNQVIEHIPQPDLVLAAIHARLAPGGRVVMVFPNVESLWCKLSGARWINWHVPYHLHHFSLDTFSRLVQRCGYKVVQTRTVTPNLWTILQVRASRKVPVRGCPAPLWVAPVPVAADASTQAGQSTLRAQKLARRLLLALIMIPVAVVNRLVDALGRGDSLVVEMVPLVHT